MVKHFLDNFKFRLFNLLRVLFTWLRTFAYAILFIFQTKLIFSSRWTSAFLGRMISGLWLWSIWWYILDISRLLMIRKTSPNRRLWRFMLFRLFFLRSFLRFLLFYFFLLHRIKFGHFLFVSLFRTRSLSIIKGIIFKGEIWTANINTGFSYLFLLLLLPLGQRRFLPSFYFGKNLCFKRSKSFRCFFFLLMHPVLDFLLEFMP